MNERMTVAEFKRRGAGSKGTTREARAPKANKYGARRVTVGGIAFDSKAEADRYQDLMILQRSDHIADLQLQVSIPLLGRDGPLKGISGRALTYRADFTYRDTSTGQTIIEDVKGFLTKEYRLKRSILAAQGIEVTEV
jgi:hypothetical protein